MEGMVSFCIVSDETGEQRGVLDPLAFADRQKGERTAVLVGAAVAQAVRSGTACVWLVLLSKCSALSF